MTLDTPAVLRVTRRFNASAERVFSAWLDPKTTCRWLFATATGKMVRVEIDARVGGRFTMVDRRDGEDVEHTGEYLEIDRPRRLVFTLAVPKFSRERTRVCVEIVSLGESGCELTLTHEGPRPEHAARTEAGWKQILEGLAASLDDNVLRITRRFDFPPERVFDTWVNPGTAAKWLFTTPKSEWHNTEMDVRVGGRWTIVDRREGTDYKAIGEYLEVDRPRRLVFTFGMPQFSAEFARVIVEIEPAGTGCVLTLTHERLPWAAISETEKGWTAMLDRLEASLAA
jgi:uncharacterized protein YndB with AHSA1/START domain